MRSCSAARDGSTHLKVIQHWAKLRARGPLAKKETALDANFLQEVFGKALGYRPPRKAPRVSPRTQFHRARRRHGDGALGFRPGTTRPRSRSSSSRAPRPTWTRTGPTAGPPSSNVGTTSTPCPIAPGDRQQLRDLPALPPQQDAAGLSGVPSSGSGTRPSSASSTISLSGRPAHVGVGQAARRSSC